MSKQVRRQNSREDERDDTQNVLGGAAGVQQRAS